MRPPTERELEIRAHQRVLRIVTFGEPRDPFVRVVDAFDYLPDGTAQIHRTTKLRAHAQFIHMELGFSPGRLDPDPPTR